VVPVNPDTVVETDESFFLNLSAPSHVVLANTQATCLIIDDDAPTLSHNDVGEGSEGTFSLGVVPAVNYFRVGQRPRSSYEIVVDGATGDVVPLNLERLAADNATVLQSASPVSGGASLSLRWRNDLPVDLDNQTISVGSGGCTVCLPTDVYHLRSYDTTYTLARYNNSGSQITVVVLQNGAGYAVAGTLWFWSASGVLTASSAFDLAPHGSFVLNTAGVAPNSGGSVTASSDGRYGDIFGKAVAVEPTTGFTFDTPLLPRPK
jgi:hypothetical protein